MSGLPSFYGTETDSSRSLARIIVSSASALVLCRMSTFAVQLRLLRDMYPLEPD